MDKQSRRESRWQGLTLLLPMLAALAVGVPTFQVVNASQQRALESQLQATLTANRESMQLWLESEWQRARHALESAKLAELIASGNRPRLDARLQDLEEGLQGQAVSLIDMEGRLLASSVSWTQAPDFSRARGLVHLRRGENTVLGLQRRGPGQSAWVSLAVPLERAEGQPVRHALLLHRLAGAGLSRTLAVARFGATGESYAFGPEGELYTESRFPDHLQAIGLLPPAAHSAILGLRLGDPGVNLVQGQRNKLPAAQWPLTRMAQSAVAGRSGIDVEGYRDYRGVRVIGAWQWLDELGFGLATEIDEAEAYQPVRVVAQGFAVFGLMLAAGSLALAWQQRRQALQRRALAAAAQELQAEIKVRREAEIEREQALLIAEHASRAKTRFLANMSHEIRTPMNAVLGYVQLLQRDGQLGPEERHKVNAIARAGQHLLALINSVLDMAKIEAGHIDLQDEVFDLSELLQGLDELFELRCRQQGLTWCTGLVLPKPCPVRGDRHKLNQVLINLVGNAMKFGRERIELRAERLIDGRFRFLIHDDGPGLPENEAEHVFEAFHQGEEGIAKGGTGLGLAITRGLVHAMGGRVRLRNANPGCEASVELPLAAAAELAPKAVRQGPVQGRLERSVRALVVDDNDDNRRILGETLQGLGAEVQLAVDGQEGCDLALARPPDIIYMDLRMPRMDGIQALKHLRAQAATAQLPIVAVSASSLTMRREDFLSAGFDEAVSKPFMLMDIVATLTQLLGVHLIDTSSPARQDLPPATGRPHVPEALRHALREAAELGELTKAQRLLDGWLVAGGDAEAVELLRQMLRRFDWDGFSAALAEADHD
ncbi:hybrid sensor histidine kinase/response regulator [Roseateles microcysteis]|uniref:hybrid sensor histidine kinase/response regulator n=1 Tax=Roseateles microcysteis TaxID=3119057 RepID=UPI002FE59651